MSKLHFYSNPTPTRDFFKIPKAENIGVLVAQKKDFTPHFVELISD